MQQRDADDDLLEELLSFMEKVVRPKPDRIDHEELDYAPILTDKACLEGTHARGGVREVLWEQMQAMDGEGKKDYRGIPSQHAIRGGHSAVLSYAQMQVRRYPAPDLRRSNFPTLSSVRIRTKPRQPPLLRPITVPELGGKVRIATMHPAVLVYTARDMTSRLLPGIRHLLPLRDVMGNRPIRITSTGPRAKVYSADLSKATDYMPHKVAQAILLKMAEIMEIESHESAAIKVILGRQTVNDEQGTPLVTKGGVHMGLGLGWIALNIVNMFAAYKAGVPATSFAVCGDDLCGYWTQKNIQAYEHTVSSLGLVINKEKSFIGDAGVFCEQFVRVVSPQTAESMSYCRLAEATAAKRRTRSTRVPIRTLIDPLLKTTGPLRNLALRTVSRLQAKLPQHTLGRVAAGGIGNKSDAISALMALRKGHEKVRGKNALSANRIMKDVWERCTNDPSASDDLQTDSIQAAASAAIRRVQELSTDPEERKNTNEIPTDKQFFSACRAHRRAWGRKIKVRGLLPVFNETLTQSRVNSRDRYKIKRLLRLSHPPWREIERLSLRQRRSYITRTELRAVLETHDIPLPLHPSEVQDR